MPIDVTIQLDARCAERTHLLSPSVVNAVHARDDHTCRCCGLRSLAHQGVVITAQNWRDLDSIATTCIFCQQCFHLPTMALMRSGVLIGFTGLTQAELNRLMVDVYTLRVTMGNAPLAKQCLDVLMGFRKAAVDRIGSDDPGALIGLLHDGQHDGTGSAATANLQDIRLLPLDRRIITTRSGVQFNAFPQILAYWRSAVGSSKQDKAAAQLRIERFNQRFA